MKPASLKPELLSKQNFTGALDAAMRRPVQDYSKFDISKITGNAKIACFGELIKPCCPRIPAKPGRISYGFLWGSASHRFNMDTLRAALLDNAKVILCEDGFLRSATTWCDDKVDAKYKKSCSFTTDTHAYYFDAINVSDIEKMLNDEKLVLTDEQLAESRNLINIITRLKLSKYNHQPIYRPEIGNPDRKKVLVVDQSYGDFSVRRGLANDATFAKMLERAISENPGCDILVKTHPDTMTGNAGGYYQKIKDDRVIKVTSPINPYSLLEIVDKVYVCCTQFGLEALLAGKEVHTFGMPIYAGWGLTVDDLKLPRRTNKRTLEELFYIFYCIYTHWVNPITGQPCSINEAIDYLLAVRQDFWQKYGVRHEA